ncbi:HlyD family type I secretion membrane fusion protein [Chelatococcus caeni]|uniref:Membrane fusion protein (MFP) family protein n=1 Tax=Chelatococcus caeni TaxID=1348468 RepID=A0A840C0B7_9HYPH|nr:MULTISPECIES: HlyD family type I secretion periplasmic adaptor subunit [Chelatococcus]MBB4018914.1 HlyD family type I secretion membrane fusion protein [Chelatococcus caeni]
MISKMKLLSKMFRHRLAQAFAGRPRGAFPADARLAAMGAVLAVVTARAAGVLARLQEAFERDDQAGKGKTLIGDWRTPARRGLGVVVLTFGVLGGWASIAQIDSGVVASGSVVVESDRKAVQHLEGGIVKDLLVTNDAHVEEGQVLIRLDATQVRAQEDMARSAFYSAQAEEARLEAEAEALDAVSFPPELVQQMADPAARRAADDELRQFREHRSARKIQVSILGERIAQAKGQIRGAVAQRDAAQSQLASVDREYAKLKPLAEKGLVPVSRVATLERSKAELEGRVGSLEADMARLERTIEEARLQIAQVEQKTAEDASVKLAETRARLADAREKLGVAVDRSNRVNVRAPRAGRVVGLKVHTIGAVVRPSDTLMEIVPDDDRLIVSAKMSPLDVNHVHVGLPAEVRLPSFKARTTPIAIGEVRSVAADALRDELTGQTYYELKVSVQVAQFPEDVREKLKPGMPADVLVATGERTVFAYLTQPLMDAVRRGMREN